MKTYRICCFLSGLRDRVTLNLLLRKLDQKRRWDSREWLVEPDFQADAFRCLATIDNKLSVYLLSNTNDQLGRAIAALALARDHIAQIDVALAPTDVLEECEIQYQVTEGKTPDPEVNDWHRDLVELSSARLVRLATAIRVRGEIRRYNARKVEAFVRSTIESNNVAGASVNPKMASSLTKRQIPI